MRENGQSVFNVFDIYDTRPDFGHEFDEPPYVWQIEPEDFQNVSEQLNQAYGFSSELGTQIAAISRNFAQNLETLYIQESVHRKTAENSRIY